MMKKLLCALMVIMMCVGLAACGNGTDTTPAGESATGKHFVIATDKGFSPFEFQDANGDIVGIDMDILAAIAEDQGFTYDLQYIGWDAAKIGRAHV